MKSFDYIRPTSITEAIAAWEPGAAYLGGGTNLVDLMKAGVIQPGKLIDLRVQPGDEVTKDQTLAVMEAMKMEHSLKSPRDGVVKAVGAEIGEQVAEGVMLVELEEV